MLHAIFQNHHIPPHEVYNLPKDQKLFMFASEILTLEQKEKAMKKGG